MQCLRFTPDWLHWRNAVVGTQGTIWNWRLNYAGDLILVHNVKGKLPCLIYYLLAPGLFYYYDSWPPWAFYQQSHCGKDNSYLYLCYLYHCLPVLWLLTLPRFSPSCFFFFLFLIYLFIIFVCHRQWGSQEHFG